MKFQQSKKKKCCISNFKYCNNKCQENASKSSNLSDFSNEGSLILSAPLSEDVGNVNERSENHSAKLQNTECVNLDDIDSLREYLLQVDLSKLLSSQDVEQVVGDIEGSDVQELIVNDNLLLENSSFNTEEDKLDVDKPVNGEQTFKTRTRLAKNVDERKPERITPGKQIYTVEFDNQLYIILDMPQNENEGMCNSDESESENLQMFHDCHVKFGENSYLQCTECIQNSDESVKPFEDEVNIEMNDNCEESDVIEDDIEMDQEVLVGISNELEKYTQICDIDLSESNGFDGNNELEINEETKLYLLDEYHQTIVELNDIKFDLKTSRILYADDNFVIYAEQEVESDNSFIIRN